MSHLGTLLASGSDDMNIVLWRWDLNKPYIVFESGHRSNVFQVRTKNVTSCGVKTEIVIFSNSIAGFPIEVKMSGIYT